MSLVTDTSVRVGPETEVMHSFLRHTTVGRNCRLINSVIEGHPEWPVVIGDHVTLINCHVRSTGEKNRFAFCGWTVDQRHTCLGDGVAFSNSRLCNVAIEAGVPALGPLLRRATSVLTMTCGTRLTSSVQRRQPRAI